MFGHLDATQFLETDKHAAFVSEVFGKGAQGEELATTLGTEGIGIATGGGDCPRLNAVIRPVPGRSTVEAEKGTGKESKHASSGTSSPLAQLDRALRSIYGAQAGIASLMDNWDRWLHSERQGRHPVKISGAINTLNAVPPESGPAPRNALRGFRSRIRSGISGNTVTLSMLEVEHDCSF